MTTGIKQRQNYQLESTEQAVTIRTKLPVSWFRGHAETYGNLAPSVYRIPPTERGGYREYWSVERFRLRAGSVQEKLPHWDDHIRWLLLMQHHGLRTRLLDWTESILVALYFAVRASVDKPGEIWCIRPDALNNRSGYYLHSADHPSVKYLAAEPFLFDRNKRTEFARELNVRPISNPIAFYPPMDFPRMSAQSSRFTIHPLPEGANTIEFLLERPRQMVRYEVPAGCKGRLARDLTALGITEETLFRTLDALASTINAEVYDPDRGEDYPDPPLLDSVSGASQAP